MRRRPMHCVPLLLVIATFFAGHAAAQVITEFPVPAPNGSPNGITVGPDGNFWFTEFSNSRVGRMTPAGVITEFPLNPNTFPEEIVTGPDGNLWIAGALGKLIRLTTCGTFIEFVVPGSGLFGITVGPDGNIWFADASGSRIGRSTTTGTITMFSTPTPASQPYFVTTGPDGNLWFTEYGGNRVGRVTPSGVMTEFTVPTANAHPYGIVRGPDGNIWFAETFAGKIARITPAGGITEFPIPGGGGPFSIVVGGDANLWLTDSFNKIQRLTTAGSLTTFPLAASSSPSRITEGPEGNLWFTESGTNKIARITTACSDDATSLCLANKRFRVRAAWRTASASGQGTAVKSTDGTGSFWFFSPDNVEVLVKALNGCGITNTYWVFASGLTNIEVTLTVTDTVSGAVKTYVNPLNTNFQAILDTGAFATCP